MDRNIVLDLYELKDISSAINKLKNEDEIHKFLTELFTDAELIDMTKRWRILNMLCEGYSQREIAKTLKVSLCKITRGAKIIKNEDSIVTMFLRKDKTNE